MCPLENQADCTIADNYDFRRTYAHGFDWHLCIDNQPDCTARLTARYFQKKYYLEGRRDWKLIGAAAHLFEDASCPDHWYPMKEYFGKVIIPFAPLWVGKVEHMVNSQLEAVQRGKGDDNWNIPINYKGQTIQLNKAYLDNQKQALQAFLAQEPVESLAELEKQTNAKHFWSRLRSNREMFALVIIFILPFWIFYLQKWLKKKKGLTDLIIMSFVLVILVLLLLLTQLFF